MAVKKEMVIEIAPDGSLKIKTEGFKGSECDDELKPIERNLGKTTKRERTNEYYQQDTSQKQKNRNTTE